MALNIITRDLWGADQPQDDKELRHPVTYVFTTNIYRRPCHSLEECSEEVKRIQEFHMKSQAKPDIRQNFIVASNGSIYEGRGWSTEPLLPFRYQALNCESIVIGYFGMGYSVENLPKRMNIAGRLLVEYGIKNGYISRLFLYNDQMSYQTRRSNERQQFKNSMDKMKF